MHRIGVLCWTCVSRLTTAPRVTLDSFDQIQEDEVAMKEVPLSKSSLSTAHQHDEATPQNHRLKQTFRNQRHVHTSIIDVLQLIFSICSSHLFTIVRDDLVLNEH